MKILKTIGISVLIAGACAFLIVRPTNADTGTNTSAPTHKVRMGAYGIFELKKFGKYCMPENVITKVPSGEAVSVRGTKSCEGVPHDFKRVSYKEYSGWMWDFSLQELDPEEVALLTEQVPVIKEEIEEEAEIEEEHNDYS